ncbi:MAG: hypothetical protein GX146_00370 [Myxococcales bacterium]|nr:hypothetical protein [Myxococcales bacterium]
MRKNAFMMIAIALVAASLAACGGNPHRKTLTPGNIHPDGSFDGVFHSEAYGRMEFTVNGDKAAGLYEGERHYGKIDGTINGDIMLFKWYQWNEDLSGKVRQSSGRGYFRYEVIDEGTVQQSRLTHFLKGEWGYGDDNAGNPWEAVRHSNAKKMLQSRDSAQEDDAGATAFDRLSGGGGSSSSSSGSSSGSSSSPSSTPTPSTSDEIRSLF